MWSIFKSGYCKLSEDWVHRYSIYLIIKCVTVTLLMREYQFSSPRMTIKQRVPLYMWVVEANWVHIDLTHWGRVTHICVSKLTIIVSDNGLSPGRRQAIIWTNDGILSIRTFRTHFSEIVSEINTFSFKKMHFKMSGKWRPSCLGLNVLTTKKTARAAHQRR